MNTEVKDLDGLYYPHIHVRDEDWLKSTLLYFPHVLRMVPPGLETRDTPFIRSLTNTRGARSETLLSSYDLRSLAAIDAVDRLTFRLIHDMESSPDFAKRFSQDSALKAYGESGFQFLIL